MPPRMETAESTCSLPDAAGYLHREPEPNSARHPFAQF